MAFQIAVLIAFWAWRREFYAIADPAGPRQALQTAAVSVAAMYGYGLAAIYVHATIAHAHVGFGTALLEVTGGPHRLRHAIAADTFLGRSCDHAGDGHDGARSGCRVPRVPVGRQRRESRSRRPRRRAPHGRRGGRRHGGVLRAAPRQSVLLQHAAQRDALLPGGERHRPCFVRSAWRPRRLRRAPRRVRLSLPRQLVARCRDGRRRAQHRRLAAHRPANALHRRRSNRAPRAVLARGPRDPQGAPVCAPPRARRLLHAANARATCRRTSGARSTKCPSSGAAVGPSAASR